MIHRAPSRQRGIAMLIALMVVALATTAAAWMATRQQLDVRRTENLLQRDLAYSYVLAAEKWVMSMLEEDLRRNNAYDDWDETQLRARGLTVPIEDGMLTGYVRDLNRCFNLNNLVRWDKETQAWVRSDDDVAIFQRYIRLINEELKNQDLDNTLPESFAPDLLVAGADKEEESETGLSASPSLLSESSTSRSTRATRRTKPVEIPETIVHKIVDWIDTDIDPYLGVDGEGAEDMAYSRLDNPYLTPNNLITNLTELRLIDGIYDERTRSEIYRALIPHVCALPGRTAINVNTAPATLIAALVEDLSLNDAETLVSEAQSTPYKNAADFNEKLLALFPVTEGDAEAQARKQRNLERLQSRTGVATHYFEVIIEGEIGIARSRLQSLLYRTSKGDVLVLSRAQGRM